MPPVILTVRPIRVSPVFVSVTFPAILPVCWLNTECELNKNDRKKLRFRRNALCFTLLRFNFNKSITTVLTHGVIRVKQHLLKCKFQVKKVKLMLRMVSSEMRETS